MKRKSLFHIIWILIIVKLIIFSFSSCKAFTIPDSLMGAQLIFIENYPAYNKKYQFFFNDSDDGYYVTSLGGYVSFSYRYYPNYPYASINLLVGNSLYITDTIALTFYDNSNGDLAWDGSSPMRWFHCFGVFQLAVASPMFHLSVTKVGAGSGTITSSPAGINCGGDCSEDYNPSTKVTLTATPTKGSTFNGWSGACAGTGICTVTMDVAKSVTATFLIESASSKPVLHSAILLLLQEQ